MLTNTPRRAYDGVDATETSWRQIRTSRLHDQAGDLLTSPGSSQMIRSMEGASVQGAGLHQLSFVDTSQAARAAENPQVLSAMNANTDQVSAMLALSPDNTALFDKLARDDERAALQFAVHHSEIQTHALHDIPDQVFRQRLRLELTGTA